MRSDSFDLVPFLGLLIPTGWLFHDHLPQLGAVAFGLLLLAVTAWLTHEVGQWLRLGRHRRRLDQLQAFADALPGGLLDGRGFYQEGRARVRGNDRGRAIQLVVALHETRPVIVYQLRVEHPVARFDLFEPGLPARLTRSRPQLRGSGIRSRSRQDGAALQRAELDRTTRYVLCGLGVEQLRLDDDGQLVATKAFQEADLEPARLRAIFDGLARVASACARRRIAVRVLGGLGFVWTGGGGVRCPYCHDAFEAEQEDLSACTRCRTVHHVDCFQEAGGCTLLGCEGLTATQRPSSRAPRRRVA